MSREWLAFVRPLPAPVYASSGWDDGRTPPHHSLDLLAPTGTAVYSIGPGTVRVAGYGGETDSRGNWIEIIYPGDMVVRYLHLSRINVKRGQKVERGQLIARSGNTGHSSAPHLHLDAILPQPQLALYVAMFGKPRDGFPLWGRDSVSAWHKVPIEPLIPVDEYRPQVTREAKENHVALYASIPRLDRRPGQVAAGGFSIAAAGLGLLALVGAGVYFMRTRGS